MKIARKHIHAREDCFAASEGNARVHISTHRNTVLLTAEYAGKLVIYELSLSEFAQILTQALRDDKKRVHRYLTAFDK